MKLQLYILLFQKLLHQEKLCIMISQNEPSCSPSPNYLGRKPVYKKKPKKQTQGSPAFSEIHGNHQVKQKESSGKPKNSPSSYRPISLTSCLCKHLERILNSGSCGLWKKKENSMTNKQDFALADPLKTR